MISLIYVWEKNGASDQSGTICQNGTTVEPFSRIFPKKVENGTTFPKVELFWLHCGAVFPPKKGFENGPSFAEVVPKRYLFWKWN